MKKLLFIIITNICLLSVSAKEITRLEPAFWWVGMKNPELQLLVYGHHIGESTVKVDYPGVRLKEIAKVENPNYLFLYLILTLPRLRAQWI